MKLTEVDYVSPNGYLPDLDSKAIDLGQHMLRAFYGEDQFAISTFLIFIALPSVAREQKAASKTHYHLDMFKAVDQKPLKIPRTSTC